MDKPPMMPAARTKAGWVARLAAAAERHAAWVVGGWVAVAVGLAIVAPSLTDVGVQDETSFLPNGAQSKQANALLAKRFPEDPTLNAGVVVFTRDKPLTRNDHRFIDRLARTLHAAAAHGDHDVTRVTATGLDPRLSSALQSGDKQAELMLVGFGGPPFSEQTNEAVDWLTGLAKERAPPGLTSHVTGMAGLGADENRTIRDSFDTVGLVSVLLVLAILLWVYRSVVAAMVPLATIAVAFVVAESLLALFAQAGVQVASLAATFMVVMVFGAGTDYCLFLVSRYRAELNNGEHAGQALQRTTRLIGPVILASGATVAFGFLSQLTARFGFYRTMGPAIAVAIAVTVLAALTLTPAILALLGRRAFWPNRLDATRRRDERATQRWQRLGHLVGARPAELSLSVILGMLLLASGLGWLHTSSNIANELPADAPSRVGAAAISEHFPAGALAPVSVIVDGARRVVDHAQLAAIDRLTDRLRTVPGIAEVRSPTQPAGHPLTARAGSGDASRQMKALGLDPNKVDVTPLYTELSSPRGLRLTGPVLSRYPTLRDTIEPFVGKGGTSLRLLVTVSGDPYGDAAQQAMDQVLVQTQYTLAGTPLSGAHVALAGPGPLFTDIARAANTDFLRIALVLVVVIILVLAALLRSVLLPLLLAGTALLSYAAALGFAVVVANVGLGQEAITFYLPAFLLVILVALGADYNIFITSRIREELDNGYPVRQAAIRGLVATGPVISNAGLILAGTFAALVLAPIPTLKAVGIAVAFGVLLDTYIVRPLLVPALIVLLGERAFWPQVFAGSAHANDRGRRWRLVAGGVGVTALGVAVTVALLVGVGTGGLPRIPASQALADTPGQAGRDGNGRGNGPGPGPSLTARPDDGGPATDRQPPGGEPRANSADSPRPEPSSSRTKPPASTRPSRVSVPVTGNWTYHVEGTRKVGAAGSTQPYEQNVTTVVDRIGGSDSSPLMRLRTESNAGSEEYRRRYTPTKVELTYTYQSSAGLSYGGTFNPPQLLIPWPARVGQSWRSDWSAGNSSGHTSSSITGTRTVDIGGNSYTCYTVESTTQISGSARGESRQSSCWVAELGMSAEDHLTFDGSYNGVPYQSESDSRLIRGP